MVRLVRCPHCGTRNDDRYKCACRIEASRKRNQAKNAKNIEATKFYKSARWRKFRLIIIKRDNELCQRCLIKYGIITPQTEKERLEVHHIRPREIYDGTNGYPDLRFEKTNCICVCKQCNAELGMNGIDFEFTFPEEEFLLY